MRRQHPEPIMFPPEGLHRRPLGHIPNPDRLVLARRQYKLMARMEHRHRDVVEMPSTAIHLPRSRLGHPPKLDLSIISTRHDERECGMEGRPVDSSIMTLEDVFDDRVCVAEEIRLTLVRSRDLLLERHWRLMRLVLLP